MLHYVFKRFYTTLTNFSTKYLVMCKVYTDVGDIKSIYHVYPPVCKTIHSVKIMGSLHVQADNPLYNYFISFTWRIFDKNCYMFYCVHKYDMNLMRSLYIE